MEEKAVNKALLWLKVGHKKLRAGPKFASSGVRSQDLRIAHSRSAYADEDTLLNVCYETDALTNCAKGAIFG